MRVQTVLRSPSPLAKIILRWRQGHGCSRESPCGMVGVKTAAQRSGDLCGLSSFKFGKFDWCSTLLKRSFIAKVSRKWWKGRRIYFVMFVNHDGQTQHHPPQVVPSISTGQHCETSRDEEKVRLREPKEAVSTLLFVYAQLGLRLLTRILRHECNCYLNAAAYRMSLQRRSKGTTTT